VTPAVRGTGPFTCAFYDGPGAGTRPGGVSLSGCRVAGATDADDLPGTYGFLVTVRDACGAAVEIPIAYRHGDCNASSSSGARIDPVAWPPRVPLAAITGYGWMLATPDIDVPCHPTLGCMGPRGGCGWCLAIQAATRAPTLVAMDLDCANPGDVCSTITSTDAIAMCPDSIAMNREVTVRPHATLRPAGAAWLSLTLGLQYSGPICPAPSPGNKAWSCHLEVLERGP
jgi:hypothetical protein